VIKSDGREVYDIQEICKVFLTDFTATKVNEHTYKLWHDAEGRFPKGMLKKAEDTNPSFIDIELKKLESGGISFIGTAILNLEAYQGDLKKWKDYWTWKNNRNEARAELEAKSLYDTKHAMHLVRLLKMAKEILEEGEVRVKRPDAKELLGIRNGEKTYEEIISFAEEMDLYLEKTYKNSPLPRSVDMAKAQEIYFQMLSEFHTIKI
jgi:hypothetical protein